MKIKKLLYSTVAVLALSAAGGVTASASHVHNTNRVSNAYRISRCAHVPAKQCHHWEVSPENPKRNVYYPSRKVLNSLKNTGYRIYGDRGAYKSKHAWPITPTVPSSRYDSYVNGKYDLTSKPDYSRYGVLITDRAGTHYLAEHHVEFRDLKETRNANGKIYELLDSRYPHFIGWVDSDGVYNLSLPTANGPYTKRQLKQYKHNLKRGRALSKYSRYYEKRFNGRNRKHAKHAWRYYY